MTTVPCSRACTASSRDNSAVEMPHLGDRELWVPLVGVAVVIWYQPTLAPEVVTELADIVSRFNDNVVLSPNSRLTSPVVATSWRRLKAYSGADDELEEFITTYRNRGPESFRCAY